MSITWALALEMFKPVVASLFGAGVGAFAASRLARKFKRRDELTDELRRTRAAMAIGFTVCNTYLNLKQQHVSKLKKDLDSQREAILKRKTELRSGATPEEIHVRLDLETIAPIDAPVTALENIVIEKTTATTQAISLAVMLKQTARSLNDCISSRNGLIADRQKANKEQDDNIVSWYLGLPKPSGEIDYRYSGAVDAIHAYTDDCIAFSKLLCDALVKHGREIKSQLYDGRGQSEIIVGRPDFSSAIDKGLMPDFDRYKDWSESFAPAVPDTVNKKRFLLFWTKG